MNIENRLRKLEQSTHAGCENHTAVLIRKGDPTPHCTRCGATLTVMILPRKMEKDEWEAAQELMSARVQVSCERP